VPVFADAEVNPRRCWAGLYEVTPDHHAIIGPAPEVEGFYLANGFSGHGVMHSPASGRVAAEWILYDEPRTIDARALQVERFRTGHLLHETAVL
jgi:sarcosine oxidase subunit beta